MKDLNLNLSRLNQLSTDLDECLSKLSELDFEFVDVRNQPESAEYRVLTHRINIVKSNINLIAKELYALTDSFKMFESIDG